MGNYYFKQQEREMSMVEVNKERVLDVYLNVYSNSSDQSIGSKIYKQGEIEQLIGSNSGHYSIIIDRMGESTDDQHPIGLEIHLVLKDPNNSKETSFKSNSRESNSSKLVRSVKVGKALLLKTKEYVESDDFDKTYIIGKHFFQLYNNFIKDQCGGDKEWGRINNCHNFTRLCLEDLDIKWPESVSSPSDDYPFLVEKL
ncbi:hypothetical protein RB653_007431 [Dictyostelium firmibasis]|uniref:Uncharacterized protein n=1 Tax=Dictyostelium firmibasis TaxID=79012 RepID=A0AAN7YXK5_9MYCE